KTAYEISTLLDFRRVLFRSLATGLIGLQNRCGQFDECQPRLTKIHAACFKYLEKAAVEQKDAFLRYALNNNIELACQFCNQIGKIGRASCREKVEISVVGVG